MQNKLGDLYKSIVGTDYENNEAYYEGNNVLILSKNPQRKPDNRVPTAFARLLVDTITGYAGRAGNIRYEYTDQQDEKSEQNTIDFTDLMQEIYSENNEALYTSEQYEEVAIQGNSFEVFYTEESDSPNITIMPKFVLVPKNQFAPIYSSHADRSLIGGVWFRTLSDKTIIATVYTDQETTVYTKPESQTEWKLAVYEDGRQNPMPNPYGKAIISEYTGSRRKTPFWKPIKSLIDAHDESANKALNEMEKFADNILLLADRVTPEFIENLAQHRVIDGLADSDGASNLPRYLERTLNSDYFQFMTLHYERLIHKISNTPDMSDENFANNTSGEALKYKLQGLEYQASQLDSYFDQGIKNRFDIIKRVLEVDPKVAYDVMGFGVNIIHERTLPPDLLNLSQVARNLVGILSPETIIKTFPVSVVENVQDELERLQDNQQPFSAEETAIDNA